MKKIIIREQSGTDFRVHENSNYLVMMTYDVQEVISFNSFQRLSRVLNEPDVEFVTLNDRIRKKSTIVDISPTKQLTPRQREAQREIRAQNERVERRKIELEKIKKTFDIEFYNAIYGQGKWKHFESRRGPKGSRHVLTQQDRTDCWKAFEKQYPEEAKEINEITK